MTPGAALLVVAGVLAGSALGWCAVNRVVGRRERARAERAAADLALCERLWALPARDRDRG
ncbi:hypothetical protein AB0K51_26060 [Kitasatospora sp. NPDC049285]|uniref:hypothetical protein n=1 Tax=Kitasatospora sp. NPDC049285 TaxID=3157096 RepID=UPI00342FC1ED